MTAECDYCKAPFFRDYGHLKRTKNNFCSGKCSCKYQTGVNHHHFYSHIPFVKCLICAKEIKRKNLKYCSNKCFALNIKGKNNYRYNKVKTECTLCKREIIKQPSLVSKTNFCSKKCQNKYHSNSMKGTNNPNYIHGDWLLKNKTKLKFKYKGFTLKIKKKIINRDKNICVNCGIDNIQHGQNMHIHHIDHNKENNNINNLCCLCKHCHGKVHGKYFEQWKEILYKKLEKLK